MNNNSEPTSERVDGPTPNGGDYSVAYWLDDDDSPTSKASAARIRIVEYSASGKPFFRTYGTFN